MAEQHTVKLSSNQTKVLMAVLLPYQKSPAVQEIIAKVEKAVEYRKDHPSPYIERRKAQRAKDREHLQPGYKKKEER